MWFMLIVTRMFVKVFKYSLHSYNVQSIGNFDKKLQVFCNKSGSNGQIMLFKIKLANEGISARLPQQLHRLFKCVPTEICLQILNLDEINLLFFNCISTNRHTCTISYVQTPTHTHIHTYLEAVGCLATQMSCATGKRSACG